MPTAPAGNRIVRTNRLSASVTKEPWPLTLSRRDDIDRHWQRRVTENPAFFNGQIFVLRALSLDSEACEAQLSLENFADFLYWRDDPTSDPDLLDGFCSAIVRSAEGHILLGQHVAGTLNAGRLTLPGGFLDARDARADGTIDVDGAIARELVEETGLDAGTLQRVPGYLVARTARACAFAATFRSPSSSTDLRRRMLETLTSQSDPELADIVVVRSRAGLSNLNVTPHACFLLAHILGEDG